MLNACRSLEGLRIPVEYLPVNGKGVVLAKDLESSLHANASLVSIMMANNEIGTIEPIEELCDIAHSCGALFHTDAVQAVGHIPVDVKKLGVDMLSASAHKFNGMKGSGFLFASNRIDLHPFMDGGGQERGFRAGTENIPAIVAMAVALKKNCERMGMARQKLTELENVFLRSLSLTGIDFIRNGNETHLPGNVNISTGSACDSSNTQVSHVIKAIGVPSEYAYGTIRISFGMDNTTEQASTIARVLEEVIKGV